MNYFKITISILLTVFGLSKIVFGNSKWAWICTFWGILDLVVLYLDHFIYSSNLELFSIYYLVLSIMLVTFYYQLGSISLPKLLPILVIPLVVFLTFSFEIINVSQKFYSKYGYLNVKEYLLSTAVICLIHFYFSVQNIFYVIKQSKYSIDKLIFLFGLAIYFVGYILYNTIGFINIDNINVYVQLGIYFIPVHVLISKGLMLTSLIWME